MRRSAVVVLTLGLALCVSGNAWAGTVYSNLGSGGSAYNCCVYWFVSTAASTTGTLWQPAFSFTPGSTSYFTELDVALGITSGANSVTVELMSDSGGQPGSVLQSWSVNGLPSLGTCCALQTLLGNGTIPLTSGTPYWVAVLPAGADTRAGWNLNSTGAAGTQFENQGAGWFQYSTSQALGAFEVQGVQNPGTGVPEPGTAVLTLAAGMLALLGKLRRRCATHMNDEPPPPICRRF